METPSVKPPAAQSNSGIPGLLSSFTQRSGPVFPGPYPGTSRLCGLSRRAQPPGFSGFGQLCGFWTDAAQSFVVAPSVC
ncbi:unnamed protein product [Gadus morhua 'NCC']